VAENLADGSVRIEARGDPAALTAFSRWCETGPADANVSAVRIEKRE
jgi:acylphosphatase